MARTSQDISARIGSVERSLQRLSQDFLTGNRPIASLPEEIEQVTAALKNLRPLPSVPGGYDLSSAKAAAARLHTLVESAFGLHCGALLTNPAVEITYTPTGEMYTAGEANLSVNA